jgi:hypothetical protein
VNHAPATAARFASSFAVGPSTLYSFCPFSHKIFFLAEVDPDQVFVRPGDALVLCRRRRDG